MCSEISALLMICMDSLQTGMIADNGKSQAYPQFLMEKGGTEGSHSL